MGCAAVAEGVALALVGAEKPVDSLIDGSFWQRLQGLKSLSVARVGSNAFCSLQNRLGYVQFHLQLQRYVDLTRRSLPACCAGAAGRCAAMSLLRSRAAHGRHTDGSCARKK